jgi:outer membrane receptor protein involved in Fe transport
MEFEGLIANVGLRWDLWNPNTSYYTDMFAPSPEGQEDAPSINRLQPRVGVSFPVTDRTVFHLNYGAFLQRPSFQYLMRRVFVQGSDIPQTLGNPRLEPEATNSYDIGVTQGLGESFTLDVSGYYKDVKNLVDQATFTSSTTGATYTSWYNRDYADIRGFRVALSKRRGPLTGSVNYQYGVATGKSATTSYAPVAFVQDTLGYVTTKLNKVPVRDILLSFDRTHNLILTLGYATGPEWGAFSDMTLSAISFFRSGRPYTSPSNPKLINGSRTPAEYNTDLKITKTFPNLLGARATVYLEVFNLFNQKILNYDYVFAVQDAGSTNNIVTNYEKYPIDDPVNGIRYYQDLIVRPAWAVADQSFLIYDNAPRTLTFGFAIEL